MGVEEHSLAGVAAQLNPILALVTQPCGVHTACGWMITLDYPFLRVLHPHVSGRLSWEVTCQQGRDIVHQRHEGFLNESDTTREHLSTRPVFKT
jgi:hypothetical protein